jgi:hypothetical protein
VSVIDVRSLEICPDWSPWHEHDADAGLPPTRPHHPPSSPTEPLAATRHPHRTRAAASSTRASAGSSPRSQLGRQRPHLHHSRGERLQFWRFCELRAWMSQAVTTGGRVLVTHSVRRNGSDDCKQPRGNRRGIPRSLAVNHPRIPQTNMPRPTTSTDRIPTLTTQIRSREAGLLEQADRP